MSEHLDKTLRALEDIGARVTDITQNKHTKVKFETPDGEAVVNISTTPSARNAFENVKADIRRAVAELAAPSPEPVELPTPIELPQQRVRKTPWPARDKNRVAAFLNPDGHSWARPAARKTKVTPYKEVRAVHRADPRAKAIEALGIIECEFPASLRNYRETAERLGKRFGKTLSRYESRAKADAKAAKALARLRQFLFHTALAGAWADGLSVGSPAFDAFDHWIRQVDVNDKAAEAAIFDAFVMHNRAIKQRAREIVRTLDAEGRAHVCARLLDTRDGRTNRGRESRALTAKENKNE